MKKFSSFVRSMPQRSTHLNLGGNVVKGGVALSSQANLALVRAILSCWCYGFELTNILGKTVFLFYVLFRRLSAGLPTALQEFDDRFFLFTEAGASEHNLLAKNALQLPNGTWALADSSELIEHPCSAFLAAPLEDIWVIQATSPKRSRWREWSKQRDAKIYVMDWFSSNELRTLG
jgi:hypothetical protein